jgi:hypothetical protein
MGWTAVQRRQDVHGRCWLQVAARLSWYWMLVLVLVLAQGTSSQH